MTACPIRSFNDASPLFNICHSPEHPPANGLYDPVPDPSIVKGRLLWRYLLVSVIVPPPELRRPRWMLQSFRNGRAGSRN